MLSSLLYRSVPSTVCSSHPVMYRFSSPYQVKGPCVGSVPGTGPHLLSAYGALQASCQVLPTLPPVLVPFFGFLPMPLQLTLGSYYLCLGASFSTAHLCPWLEVFIQAPLNVYLSVYSSYSLVCFPSCCLWQFAVLPGDLVTSCILSSKVASAQMFF